MVRLKIVIFRNKDYLINAKKHDEKMMMIYFKSFVSATDTVKIKLILYIRITKHPSMIKLLHHQNIILIQNKYD